MESDLIILFRVIKKLTIVFAHFLKITMKFSRKSRLQYDIFGKHIIFLVKLMHKFHIEL